MKATIRNFRGIKSAALDLTKIALVASVNAAGKSSIAQAVGAALSGELVPFDGLRKADAGMLVHAGTGKATVDIETADGKISVTYPQAQLKTEGTPPVCSAFAAFGSAHERSIAYMDAKRRATILIEYLRAAPSDADIKAEAKRIGLDDKQAATLCQKIKDLDWDGAHAAAKESGIKLKAQWEHVAGERYGPTKADSWQPANWDTTLEGTSEDSLTLAQTQAKEFLEAAIAATAVSDAERAQIQAAADKVSQFDAKVVELRATVDADFKALNDAKAGKEKLARPTQDEKAHSCPHCAKGLVIRGGTLAKFAPANAKENKERADDLADADKLISGFQAAWERDSKSLAESERNAGLARAAGERLKALPEVADTTASVDEAREIAGIAERRLIAFKSKRDADRLHVGAQINARVQTMLAPNGLRLSKLHGAVQTFNQQLAALCAVAGWGTVDLSDDLEISFDGKPLALASASEQFRARITIQATMADMDRSSLLVIDAADILDKNGRNGLFRLLFHRGQPALVCMTLPSRDDVPNLGDYGYGYWITDGVLQNAAPVAVAKEG